MKNLEATIFETLKGKTNSENYDYPESLSQDLRDFFNQLSEQLVVPIDLSGYEASITGQRLPLWIKPLHFEHNLANAIDCLESVESLLKERLEGSMVKISINYYTHHFNKNNGPNNQYLNDFLETSRELDLIGKKENIELRIAKKIFELLEYTKAVKWAAKRLFKIEMEELEIGNNYEYINRIRESLRVISELQRQINKYDQEIILPISLKHSRTYDDHFVVSHWNNPNVADSPTSTRDQSLALRKSVLDISTNQLAAFRNIPNINNIYTSYNLPRLRRVGIQVIDNQSLTFPPGNNQQNIWHLRIFDVFGKIIQEDETYVIKEAYPFEFYVAADRNLNVITWNNNDGLFNMRPNTVFRLFIEEKSHKGSTFTEINDIILYLHFVYNNSWKNNG